MVWDVALKWQLCQVPCSQQALHPEMKCSDVANDLQCLDPYFPPPEGSSVPNPLNSFRLLLESSETRKAARYLRKSSSTGSTGRASLAHGQFRAARSRMVSGLHDEARSNVHHFCQSEPPLGPGSCFQNESRKLQLASNSF